jgi:hypothetical protein
VSAYEISYGSAVPHLEPKVAFQVDVFGGRADNALLCGQKLCSVFGSQGRRGVPVPSAAQAEASYAKARRAIWLLYLSQVDCSTQSSHVRALDYCGYILRFVSIVADS